MDKKLAHYHFQVKTDDDGRKLGEILDDMEYVLRLEKKSFGYGESNLPGIGRRRFIVSIGDTVATQSKTFWSIYVENTFAEKGVDDLQLRGGANIYFYLEPVWEVVPDLGSKVMSK